MRIAADRASSLPADRQDEGLASVLAETLADGQVAVLTSARCFRIAPTL
ncbi:hypothetical protein [Lentzea aerocolonigenes]|nr:hypothetical protein [Lentzea aerocolonigenes]